MKFELSFFWMNLNHAFDLFFTVYQNLIVWSWIYKIDCTIFHFQNWLKYFHLLSLHSPKKLKIPEKFKNLVENKRFTLELIFGSVLIVSGWEKRSKLYNLCRVLILILYLPLIAITQIFCPKLDNDKIYSREK